MAQLRRTRVKSAASTNAAVIKASGGYLRGVVAGSIDATPVYIKFYDKATTPRRYPPLALMTAALVEAADFTRVRRS